MSAQAAGVVPALICILTRSADAVEDVAGFTLTAVRAHQVNTTVTLTDLFRGLAFINIDAAGALFIEVVSSATVHGVPLTRVGANSVDAEVPSVAWTSLTHTLIYINAVAQSVLDVPSRTLHFWQTTERALCILALELCTTVMDACLTLIYIFTVVGVSELIARPAADLPLTPKRPLCVDAAFPSATITGAKQTLVYIFTAFSIRSEFVALKAATGVVTQALLSTSSIALV